MNLEDVANDVTLKDDDSKKEVARFLMSIPEIKKGLNKSSRYFYHLENLEAVSKLNGNVRKFLKKTDVLIKCFDTLREFSVSGAEFYNSLKRSQKQIKNDFEICSSDFARELSVASKNYDIISSNSHIMDILKSCDYLCLVPKILKDMDRSGIIFYNSLERSEEQTKEDFSDIYFGETILNISYSYKNIHSNKYILNMLKTEENLNSVLDVLERMDYVGIWFYNSLERSEEQTKEDFLMDGFEDAVRCITTRSHIIYENKTLMNMIKKADDLKDFLIKVGGVDRYVLKYDLGDTEERIEERMKVQSLRTDDFRFQ